MTTTALTALTTDAGCAICYVALIEGYSYALTDGDPAAVLAACAGGLGGHDVTDALGGLTVMFDQREAADPWKPIGSVPMLRCGVRPGPDTTGAIVDTFGRDVFRRAATDETYLRGDLDRNDTTVTVASTASFASSGVAHLGGEAFSYSGVTATTFTGVGRAAYAPFQTSAGGAFARTHRSFDPSTATGDQVGVNLQPLVTGTPMNGLTGRMCGVWILTTTPTGYVTTTQGHLAFAGVIAEATETDDGVLFSVEDIRRKIYETPILTDQFRGKIREGIQLRVGMPDFRCETWRDPTQGDADPLVVVAGAPASANEIQAGLYTAGELGDAIQAWLQAEKSAGRILFHCRYSPLVGIDGGIRAVWEYEDGTATAGISRAAVLGFPSIQVGMFLGWGASASYVSATSSTSTAQVVSAWAPLRARILGDNASGIPYELEIDNPSGTWVDQAALLPAGVRALGYDGVLKIGSLGHVAAAYASDVLFSYAAGPLTAYLPPLAVDAGSIRLFTVEDDAAELEVTQVLFAESTFKSILLQMIASTGTAGYNHATHDALGETISCGIPWSLLTDDFATDLDGLAEAERVCRVYVDKATRFSDLFNVDLQLRWAFLSWGSGRLRMRAWSTPIAAYAVLALTESTKAAPVASASGDRLRSTSREEIEACYNVVKVEYGRNPDGEYAHALTVEDAPSVRDHGARPVTLSARNAAPQDAVALISAYAANLPMFTRPRRVVRRSIRREDFELATPGALVTVTDRHIRNPETGLRYDTTTGTGGLIGWPGIVVGSRFDWGGGGRDAGGEVDVMIFDRVTHAPYSPCAQVDDTAGAPFSAGYEAAGPRLRCYAAEHSEAASANDATHFAAGDVVVIVEIDPDTAASPITWTRTVASQSGDDIYLTATLSAPAWDATKRYRIISAAYASAQASQLTDTYQADDADGLVVDVRQPYGLISSGAGQSLIFTASPSTEVPARYATLAVGDGKPYDTGYDRDIARGLNNLIDYKTAPQCPTMHEDADTYAGAGTKELVRCRPIWIGQGTLASFQTIILKAAPFFKSTDGTTATVTITLSKFPPEGDGRDDVTFFDPYVQATFSTTSTTYATPAAGDLDTRHVNRSESALGGFGYLSVEINAKVSMLGIARLCVGPRESV